MSFSLKEFHCPVVGVFDMFLTYEPSTLRYSDGHSLFWDWVELAAKWQLVFRPLECELLVTIRWPLRRSCYLSSTPHHCTKYEAFQQAAAKNIELLSLDEIWPQADFITVHVPLIPETENMINAESEWRCTLNLYISDFGVTALAKCKKGVKIINVARGGIVNEHDLVDALNSGQAGGAAFDVFLEVRFFCRFGWLGENLGEVVLFVLDLSISHVSGRFHIWNSLVGIALNCAPPWSFP